jgi:hypothetical protein
VPCFLIYVHAYLEADVLIKSDLISRLDFKPQNREEV